MKKNIEGFSLKKFLLALHPRVMSYLSKHSASRSSLPSTKHHKIMKKVKYGRKSSK